MSGLSIGVTMSFRSSNKFGEVTISVVKSTDYCHYQDVEILQCVFNNSFKINTCFQFPFISLTFIIQRSIFTEASITVSVPLMLK